MPRGDWGILTALAGLKKPRGWVCILGALVAIIALYYLIIPIIGPHYAEVCSKDKNGNISDCKYWDIVTAVILWFSHFLDEHNGLVAALAGVAVAIFTAVLWRSTEKLWLASERQLLAANRPKILFREFFLNPPTFHAKTATIFFTVSNAGGSEAIIISSDFCVIKINQIGKSPFFGNATKATAELHGILLKPGEAHQWEEPTNINLAEFESAAGAGALPIHGKILEELRIIVNGRVVYEDRAGLRRVSAFSREYDFQTDRFGPGDPEREYAD